MILSVDTLTIGDVYYISVDDNYRSGTFTLCLSDQLDYDYWEGAKVLAHDGGCQANASYTNSYATDDESMAPCWAGTENKNVWFKFQALTPFATVQLKTGNVYGTMRRGQMAIWNEQKQLVKCVGPVYTTGTNVMSIDSLTVGNWYWISVDDNYTSGSFTLCLDDIPDFDYKAGAIEVPHTVWCSANAEYSNAYATEDESMGSCWSGTENKNVWFKFQALSDFVTIELKTGNVYGSMHRGQMALWKADGSEIKCIGRVINQGTTSISYDALLPGDWYYISVDDDYTSGSFSLCMSDQPDYDYKAGAVEIQHDAGCYPDAAYSNLMASADRSQGSCWTGTENKNVWFKFQAITPELNLQISTGSVYGNMQRQQVSVWNEADVEVACTKWVGNTGTVILQTDTLTPGNWYYISVDDDRISGSFTLCINDQVDFDYRAGAIELTDISYWCSNDAEYSNVYATADRQQGSCWTGTVNKNVWFKFQAETKNAIVSVKTGTVYGNMRRQQIALWNEAGTEVSCAVWTATTGTVSLSADTLTAGNWYYISVDDDNTSGTFSLCIQGNPLDANIVGTDVSCNGNADGSITVTPLGGTELGYTYSWSKDGTPIAINTPSASNLGPGVYDITVTDIGDGSYIVRSYTVTEDPVLGVGMTSVNESCSGTTDGSATATPSGGTGSAYLYNWFRNGVSLGLTTQGITSLNAGWYKVVVTDAGALGCSVTDSVEVQVDGLLSSDPDSIVITNNNICQGTPKILTVSGGSLGTGAAWKWYLDNGFTTSAGPDGIALTVDPASNTTYWVRAEGACNTSGAVSATVLTGLPSIAPTSASVDRNDLCPADGNIVLSYTGGTLGDGATAEWYSDATFTTNVGSGNNLTLATPSDTTTYYVSFEGDCNTTAGVNVTVNIKDVSVAPTSASVDRNDLCPADGNIVLSYTGGTLGTNATAEWYSDATFTTNVGSGNNLTLATPSDTTTYYVRFEGDCNTTTGVNVTVNIKDVSVAPTSASRRPK